MSTVHVINYCLNVRIRSALNSVNKTIMILVGWFVSNKTKNKSSDTNTFDDTNKFVKFYLFKIQCTRNSTQTISYNPYNIENKSLKLEKNSLRVKL